MSTKLLSVREIASSKPRDKEYLLSDGEGLYLRIRPNNKRDWFYNYTLNKVRSKLAINKVELVDVREQADVYRKQVMEGIDPKQFIQEQAANVMQSKKNALLAQAAAENRITTKELFDKWESVDLRSLKNGSDDIRRMFEKDVLPSVGSMAIADVGKADVMRIVDSIQERGAPRMAKRMFTLIRQMLKFAQDRGYIEHEPTMSIRKSKMFSMDVERDRFLSEAEIRELAVKMPAASLPQASEAALWIVLSTGCRIGEILKASWSDVDLEKATWKIPAENSKNAEPLQIYLSEFSVSQFRKLERLSSNDFCISNRASTSHICPKSVTKQVYDRQLVQGKQKLACRTKNIEGLVLSGGKWTPHDLRRTAATLMTALGVLPDIADKCLNHKDENRIRRTYQRHSYAVEQKEAWRLLGDRLALLTTQQANNVVTINSLKIA